jgi:hypothetical protein
MATWGALRATVTGGGATSVSLLRTLGATVAGGAPAVGRTDGGMAPGGVMVPGGRTLVAHSSSPVYRDRHAFLNCSDRTWYFKQNERLV